MGFGEGVEPVGLGFVEHEEEVAVFEEDGGAEGGVFFVFEVEAAGGAEAEGGDGGVGEEHGFVVAVPGHAFGARVVEVGEAGIVGGAGGGFDAGFDGGEGGGPGLGGAGDAGVGVGEGVVAVPGDFAGGDDAFAEEADFVVLPGEFGEEGGERGGGVGLGEERAEREDGAVLGEEIGARRGAEQRRGGGHGELNLKTEMAEGESAVVIGPTRLPASRVASSYRCNRCEPGSLVEPSTTPSSSLSISVSRLKG